MSLADFDRSGRPGPALILATAAATVALLYLARAALYPREQSIIPNPLRTKIPHLSQEDVAKLEYRPDAFPGARDVITPYGTMRVYEWGPEDGQKTLFLHGISTPCVAISVLAQAMVERGHRVMIFDLFGRGFTDGVGDLPHDSRLYVSQALLALASSPLPWTGTGALCLVGYSMGGGIAAHFATAFPHMVSSLILLAPAGLVRESNFGLASRLIFRSRLVPDRILTGLARRRLRTSIASSVRRKRSQTPTPTTSTTPTPPGEMPTPTTIDTPTQDVGDDGGAAVTASELRLSLDNLGDKALMTDLAVAEIEGPGPVMGLEKRMRQYVSWMADHHDGFVPAFLSSLRHGPLMNQHAAWAGLASREPGSTCVLLARDDDIINLDDCTADGLELLGGRERVRWGVVGGGHDFVMTHVEEIMKELDDFWRS